MRQAVFFWKETTGQIFLISRRRAYLGVLPESESEWQSKAHRVFLARKTGRPGAAFVPSSGDRGGAEKPVGCTACHYCTDHGCPADIKIPEILAALNKYHMYQNKRQARFDYYNCAVYDGGKSAKDCLRCGTCMGECPQNLQIPDLLQEAMDALYAGDDYGLWANHGEYVR